MTLTNWYSIHKEINSRKILVPSSEGSVSRLIYESVKINLQTIEFYFFCTGVILGLTYMRWTNAVWRCSRTECWRELLAFWDGAAIQAWRKHHNDALHSLYVSSDVVRILKLRKICTRHVARMGQRTNARRELENLMVRGNQEYIGVDARKIINGSYRYMIRVCRLHLFDQTRAIAMELCVPSDTTNFTSSWMCISFMRIWSMNLVI
jgi:hypothetical protein